MNPTIKLLSAVASILLILGMSSAYASSTPYLTTISKNEDILYNYDFIQTTVPLSSNVDWPVTMIHCCNANVNKVKSIYYGATLFANEMKYQMNDGAGWITDTDRGTKGIVWSSQLGQYVNLHQRIYAPNPPDYAQNTSWGKYVVGTTHYDNYPIESWSGYSEYAETDFRTIALSKGYVAYSNNVNFYNNDNRGWVDSSHYFQSNGYATRVVVP